MLFPYDVLLHAVQTLLSFKAKVACGYLLGYLALQLTAEFMINGI